MLPGCVGRRPSSSLRRALVALGCIAALRAAPRADEPAAPGATSSAADPRRERPHALYAGLLGHGGPYTLGYDYALSELVGLGVAGSYFWADEDRVVTVAPYLNLYPVSGRWGALLLQGGLEIVNVTIPSAVEGWSGTSSTGVAGQLSAGYEYRAVVLFRFLASGYAGRGGVRPWFGLALGVAL